MVLIFGPKIGISHKQYFVDNDNFIKTYDTIWNNKFSYIQKRNWINKNNFPIDWTARHPLNKDENNNFKYFKNYDDFINLELIYKSKFYLLLNHDSEILINLKNLDESKSKFYLKKNDEEPIRNFKVNEILKLEKGLYNFNLISHFTSKDWKYEINIKHKDKLKSVFEERLIFYELNNNSSTLINFYQKIGVLFDYFIIFFLFFIFINIIIKSKLQTKILFVGIIFFLINIIHIKLNSTYNFDLVGSSVLSIFLILFGIFHLFNKSKFLSLELNEIYILISIIILTHYSTAFASNIYSFIWFSLGDDWEIFQVLGRLIAVDNIWVFDQEKETIRRYGIRIYIAILHILFGKSFFPQQIFEIWAIIFSAYFLSKILLNLKVHIKVSTIFGFILLIVFFGENFRWLIGRGLTEYYSLFLISITAYLFSTYSNIILKLDRRFFLLCFLGFLIVIFREDHLFIASALIFFCFNSNYQNIFISSTNTIKINYKFISIYIFFVILGILFIFLKNYLSFDDISISQDGFYFKFEKFKEMLVPNYSIKASPLVGNNPSNVYMQLKEIHYLDDFYRFFTGSDPYNIPRPTSIILISGFLISLYYIINFHKFKELNFGIVILPLVNLITPILFFTQAYNPRYIISYFPFTLMIICFFLYDFKLKKNLIFKK